VPQKGHLCPKWASSPYEVQAKPGYAWKTQLAELGAQVRLCRKLERDAERMLAMVISSCRD